MKEQKIYEHVRELGHEPIEGTAVIVSRTPENPVAAAIEFAKQTDRFGLLVCCEDCLLLFRLNNLTNNIKKSTNYRLIACEDVLDTSVELADAGMTRRIRIATDEGDILLNAQHEATSALRTSGLWGAWHAANLPRAVAEIEAMGQAAREAAKGAC